jgi:hypothetical protein
MPPTKANGKICYLEIPLIDPTRSADSCHLVFGWAIRCRGDGVPAFDDAVGEVSGAWVNGRPSSPTPGLLFYRLSGTHQQLGAPRARAQVLPPRRFRRVGTPRPAGEVRWRRERQPDSRVIAITSAG